MGLNGYSVFLGSTQFPVTPAKLDVKIKGQNKTLTLVNDGEINFLKTPGLTDINVDFLLPMLGAPHFATYRLGFHRPDYYLGVLEKLIAGKKTTQFIVSRTSPFGLLLFDTNIKVSVEDYTISENADNGFDVTVSVKLKQYRDFGTKTIAVKTDEAGKTTATETKAREAVNAPTKPFVAKLNNNTLINLNKKASGTEIHISSSGVSHGGGGGTF